MAVNYWPGKKAMYWWQSFDAGEVEGDFRKIADLGFKGVRIFLMWEDFQPDPDIVSPRALDDLVRVADIADSCGLWIMPTLFCGHMSGVNWMPEWMLESGRRSGRFPIFSRGRLYEGNKGKSQNVIRNFWMDKEVIRAQRLQCREVASTLRGHPAVVAYDLGNESSNCAVPPNRSTARAWFRKMVLEIKRHSDGCAVTFGMHAEDLEEDRKLWPQDIGRFCDFLCMHGYPFYLSWVDDPLDARVLPFLGAVTRWLGEKPVLLEEFGIPTLPDTLNDRAGSHDCRDFGVVGYLWRESDGVSFYRDAVNMLRNEGMIGAFAWCYSDYHPDLWDRPPLNCAPHERYFGIFRYDGTPKPVARVIRECSSLSLLRDCGGSWLEDENPNEFYLYPKSNLRRLYHRYKERFVGVR